MIAPNTGPAFGASASARATATSSTSPSPAVAATMRAGETALYAMRPQFAGAGVRFSVVTGDMHGDTTAVATAVVAAATAVNPSGVVCVGSADYLMTA